MDWVIGVIITVVCLVIISSWLNKKTCMRAFGEGVIDSNRKSWKEIKNHYQSFMSPSRPMDAAAYKIGIEYSLIYGPDPGWKHMKNLFNSKYGSGEITRIGTKIRESRGEGWGSIGEILNIDRELLDKMNRNPDAPPMLHAFGEQHDTSPTSASDKAIT